VATPCRQKRLQGVALTWSCCAHLTLVSDH